MSGTHPSEGSSNPSSPSSTHNAFFNYQAAVNNNAPKYGTVVPKRVFVGGITSTTTEDELCDLFSRYGIVKQVKIVVDRGGISKGYGFITFESEEEAKRLQKDSDNIMFKEKRLNIAPAIKKQGFTGTTSPVPPAPTSNMYFHNGLPYTYHNGMAYFPSNGQPIVPTSPPTVSTQETAVYPQPTYPPQGNQAAAYGAPIMYAPPTPMFMPAQQYQYSPMPLESFYQVAAPNSASYIYAAPGPPLVSTPNTTEGVQYQIYPPAPQPVTNDMYYAAPMYPMLVNYDPAYYSYSVESTASSISTGVDVSSNSNYSEDEPTPVSVPPESQETPVVSLLKLDDSCHEERELNCNSFRRPAPRHIKPNHNYNNNNSNCNTNDSPTPLVYYPSNMYATPTSHPRPNLRGANMNYSNTFRHKTPPPQRTPHLNNNNTNYNKFPRPMYYNNNNIYDHNSKPKLNNTGGINTPPRDNNNTHDSPPPPPYSPMIQPLFTNCESPYSFSPPPSQMIQPPPLPPRSYPVQNHSAPRRINPRPNAGKTSTGHKSNHRSMNRNVSILTKQVPPIPDAAGDSIPHYPEPYPTPSQEEVCFQLEQFHL